jgi:hypothetical protein
VPTHPAAKDAVARLATAPTQATVNTATEPTRKAVAGGGHEPTTPAEDDAARRILQKHRRVCVPEPACNGCLRGWPCPDVVWAWHTLPDED